MANFNDIKKANESIKPMNIKGKEYAPVNERVKAFRMVYPGGLIKTELVKYDKELIVVKAQIFSDLVDEVSGPNGYLLATGYAEEVRGSSNINRTSALENCETSAVGRALGFAGFGIDTSVASYEEVENAKLRAEGAKLATSTEKAGFIASANAKGLDYHEILERVGFNRDTQPEGMTTEQYARAMALINEEKGPNK